MKRVDYPYINLIIGDQIITNSVDNTISMTLSRVSAAMSESLLVSLYDRSGIKLETSLKDNPDLYIQYGWSEGASSPRYKCSITSYDIDFTSSIGDVRLDLEAVSTGALDSLGSKTVDYDEANIDEIVKIIAARNNWVIGNIEPTKEVYEDTAKTKKMRFRQSNLTDEEFISTVLKDKAVSSVSGKSDYIFRLDSSSGTPKVYFEPRANNSSAPHSVESPSSGDTPNRLVESSTSNQTEFDIKDDPNAGGEVSISLDSGVTYSYTLGAPNSDIIGLKMTYNGGLVSTALQDGLETEYQDTFTNEYRNTRVSNQAGEQDPSRDMPNISDLLRPPTSPLHPSNLLQPDKPLAGFTPRAESLSRLDVFVSSVISQEGKRYIYGASDPNRGFDCSGLISYGLRQAGLIGKGARYSSSNISSLEGKVLQRISKSELRPGDILVAPGKHVELYLEDKTFGAHSAKEGIGFVDAKANMNYTNYSKYYRVKDAGPLTLKSPKITNKKSNNSKSMSRSSGTTSEMELQSQSQFEAISNNMWSGQLVLLGNPNIEPRSNIDLVIYTNDGEEHPSSGEYIATEVTDSISDGDYSTTIELLNPALQDLVVESVDEFGNPIDGTRYNGVSTNSNGSVRTSDQQFAKVPKSVGHNNVVYYNQADAEWSKAGLGITMAGCGPTSTAMILSTITGKTITPIEMAKEAKKGGWYSTTNGMMNSYQFFDKMAKSIGYKSVKVTSKSQLKNYLQQGYIGLMRYGPGHWTSSGHYTVAAGITSSGQLLFNDPASREKSKKAYGDSTAFSGWRESYMFLPA